MGLLVAALPQYVGQLVTGNSRIERCVRYSVSVDELICSSKSLRSNKCLVNRGGWGDAIGSAGKNEQHLQG